MSVVPYSDQDLFGEGESGETSDLNNKIEKPNHLSTKELYYEFSWDHSLTNLEKDESKRNSKVVAGDLPDRLIVTDVKLIFSQNTSRVPVFIELKRLECDVLTLFPHDKFRGKKGFVIPALNNGTALDRQLFSKPDADYEFENWDEWTEDKINECIFNKSTRCWLIKKNSILHTLYLRNNDGRTDDVREHPSDANTVAILDIKLIEDLYNAAIERIRRLPFHEAKDVIATIHRVDGEANLASHNNIGDDEGPGSLVAGDIVKKRNVIRATLKVKLCVWNPANPVIGQERE